MEHQSFTLPALLKITRFWNLAIIILANLLTAYFLIGSNALYSYKLYLVSISATFIAAAGYIINDYYDVKIDLINKPNRVVVGTYIRRRYALFFHLSLSLIGVSLGVLLSWKIAAINFFSVALLWWYSNSLKRLPFIGNFAVALLTGLSVYIVAVLFDPFNKMIIAYSCFSFSITLIREIIKDMEDWKGDNTFGCKTLPIIWGIRKTKYFIYLLMVIMAIGFIYLNTSFFGLPTWMLGLFIFCPFFFLTIRLTTADTIKDFANLSFYCKIILLLGIFSMCLI